MGGQPTRAAFPARTPRAWRDFIAFVRLPLLPERATGPGKAALAPLAQLYGLDLLMMAALLALFGLLSLAGLKLPEHLLDEMKLAPALLALIVVGAPIAEEIVFRGFLSGRPGHLGAIAALLAAGIASWVAGQSVHSALGPFLLVGLPVIGLAAAGLSIWLGRKRPALGWFARHFRWFYYGSAIAFAAAHLSNFVGAAPAALLALLVVPQFVVGFLLGYARVTWGLWASMLLHICHNALFIALALAGA
jgi:membrane protease YdiL (CAAX protease family)